MFVCGDKNVFIQLRHVVSMRLCTVHATPNYTKQWAVQFSMRDGQCLLSKRFKTQAERIDYLQMHADAFGPFIVQFARDTVGAQDDELVIKVSDNCYNPFH